MHFAIGSPSSRSIRAWPRNSPTSMRRSTAPTPTRSWWISAPAFGIRQSVAAVHTNTRQAGCCGLFKIAVAALPSAEQIEELERCYPDLRVELHATAGRKLSDELQDGASFRYGIVNLGGSSRTEMLQRLEDCRARLGFILLPMGSTIGGEFNVERSAACENWS